MPIIFMLLLLAVLALRLARAPQAPRGDAAKSSLARDGGLGGVGFLIPASQHAEVAALRAGKRKA